MTQVAVQLPDELNRFVQQSIASGAYQNTDEFFVSVLASLKEQAESELSDEEERRLAALRADLQLGVDQLDRGETVKDLDWDDAFLAERHRSFDSRPNAS
jgi:putative addiction module CopG family antidote